MHDFYFSSKTLHNDSQKSLCHTKNKEEIQRYIFRIICQLFLVLHICNTSKHHCHNYGIAISKYFYKYQSKYLILYKIFY